MKTHLKKLLVLVLALSMVFSLAACGGGEQGGEQGNNDAAAVTYPLTITDMAGREVTIEAEPQKIVSGYYISTSTCLALGLEDKLAAIEMGADTRPIYTNASPDLVNLPSVGSAKNFDLEVCLAAEPDLVILPKKLKDTAETISEMGVPVILVYPESSELLNEMITLIGTATNSLDKAEALKKFYADTDAAMTELTKGLTDADKPSVYVSGAESYLKTVPANMYQAGFVAAAGGVNAGNVIEGDSWTEVSYEQILAMDPEYIIIVSNNYNDTSKEITVEQVLNDPELANVKAVMNKNVYKMPSGFEAWDSPVPSCKLGAKWLLNVLHPDLYADDALVKDVTDFYQTFYNYTPNASKISK